MNALKQTILYIFLIMGVAFTSCEDLDDLNTDPTRMQQANPGVFLNPVLYNVSSYNWERYNSFTFHLMQGIVTTNSTGGLGWYYMTDAAGDGTWSTYYRWLNNIKEMEEQAEELNEPNYEAIAKVLKSWLYQILVEGFGDVPMTEAIRGDEKIFTPAFDSQIDIYRTILQELDSANLLFDETQGLRYNPEGELLYHTETPASGATSAGIVKWRKFANSLKLRVLLRVLDVNGLNAKAEIMKLINDPVAYPLFESNDEAALLPVTGVYPLEAPMTRPQDFTSYKALSEFFIDHLKEWNDPRLPIFAQQTTNDGVKSYFGWPSGYNTVPSFNGSLPNQGIVKAPMKLALMTYAEVEFIKAELAQKSIISSDAANHYRKAVEAAITQWGAIVPEGYFDNSETKYDNSLERIMIQKYYALFFCDYQQWFEYNRTGMPEMPVGEGVPTGNVMPRRFKYPSTLQRTNLANYQKAKESMGGDDFNLKLIWQK